MKHSKRVLWQLNVFSRLNQLKHQESAIRDYFGDKIDILVFCNNNKLSRSDVGFLENFIVMESVNSGHHSGVRDAHNSVLQFIEDGNTI